MKKIIFTLLTFGILAFHSCVDMNILPKNDVGDDALMTSEAGMDIYMTRVYSNLPVEDFKYMAQWGITFNGWLQSLGIDGTGEAVNRDGISSAFTNEDKPYWGLAFETLRDINHLIETLPNYKSNFSETTYNEYIGNAYFARAFVFTAMAKRFGGVPLVTFEIPYEGEGTLQVARSSEEDTWNQILADYDTAIELLQPTSIKSGYANKYIALSFKSSAMLYAGSVAKYNETIQGRLTGVGARTGVRVMGFDQSKASTLSIKYFSEAYKAANEVINSKVYSLYKTKWVAGDKNAQYQNMVEMFSDKSSKENIFVKEYVYPTSTHGYDAYSSPFIYRSPLSSGTCPTLDFVELFDGLPKNANGSLKVTEDNGDYKLFDTPMSLFKDVEPRLRAYVILPGDEFKGDEIEIRAGIYTGTSLKPFFSTYAYSDAANGYQKLDIYSGTPKTLYLSPSNGDNQEIYDYNGVKMTAAGANGPFYDNGESAITGFYIRKYLNTDKNALIGEGKSAQHFILKRYAEILLDAAEAAVELSLAGAQSPDGSDMLGVATEAIKDIRLRAGADPLSGSITGTNDSRDIVRKERRKEMAFEHRTKWDLRRWRVQDPEHRDGFWGVYKTLVHTVKIMITVSVVCIHSCLLKLENISSMLVSNGFHKEHLVIV